VKTLGIVDSYVINLSLKTRSGVGEAKAEEFEAAVRRFVADYNKNHRRSAIVKQSHMAGPFVVPVMRRVKSD
jgi:hypothetical protein